jgi:hypothetical protein
MALSKPRTLIPKPLNVGALDHERFVFIYDERSDELLIYLYGAAQPSVSVPLTDYEYLRVDPTTEEVVGFQVENFLAEAVFADPLYLDWAEAVGVDADRVAALRQLIDAARRGRSPDDRRRHLAASVAARLARVTA